MDGIAEGQGTEDLVKLSVFSSIGKSIVAENSIRGVLDRVMEHVGSFFGPLKLVGPSSWTPTVTNSSSP